MRPLGSSCRAPLLDAFGMALAEDARAMQDIAAEWRPRALDVAETFGQLLLVLGDALFLSQAIRWTEQRVAIICH